MINVATLFPDGKLPPLPQMEINELTAVEISQERVDQSLKMLWDQRPDLVIALAEGELNPELRKTQEFEKKRNDVGRFLRKVAAPQVGGYETPSASDQVMWELRIRIRRMLSLPATHEEVQAALSRGEQVI